MSASTPCPIPSKPSNPSLLIADSSSLIQLIAADEMQVLRSLKYDYGVQCTITEAVEAELNRRVQRKMPDRIGTFKKALGNGTLVTLDENLMTAVGYKSSSALIDQIEQTGLQYASRVDRGEAYTHAASNVLGVPALSQDLNALRRLIDDGVHIHRPVLRAFDVIVFGLQIEILDHARCKQIRQDLRKHGETLPECFANCAVGDGLPNFYLRLCDGERPALGSPKPIGWLDERIWVLPKPPMNSVDGSS